MESVKWLEIIRIDDPQFLFSSKKQAKTFWIFETMKAKFKTVQLNRTQKEASMNKYLARNLIPSLQASHYVLTAQ